MIKRSLLLSLLLAIGSLQAQTFTPIPADALLQTLGYSPDTIEAVKDTIDTCANCHDQTGNGAGPFLQDQATHPATATPKLAGQHADYLYKQLQDFKFDNDKVARENGDMNAWAAALADDPMTRAMADYFAAQPMQPAVVEPADAKSIAIGKKLWRAGDASRNIPACAGCHGPAGKGIPSQYPALAGQFPQYIETQLKAFRDDMRANDPANMMRAVALRMTEAQIKAVSDYASRLR